MTRVPFRERAVLAAVMGLALVAYWPALPGDFAYDDFFFVVENDAIKGPDRLLEWVTDPAAGSEGKRWGTIFRPVRTLSYGLDHAAWRLNPVGYHVTSVLLHLVAVVGVWALARRVTGSGPGALIGAAVFAVHPLPSEAVAWIGARADVLGAVGALAFCLLALRPGPRHRWRAAAECGLLVLALGCKEACAAAVPVVAAAKWLLDGRPGALRRAASWAVAPTITVLAYAVVRSWLLGHTSRYAWLVDGHLGWTWLTVLRARVWDVGRVVLPARLAIDYTGFPYVRSLVEPTAWLAAGAAATAAWLAWRCRRAAPGVSVGIVAWVAFLLPVSQLIPLNALIADRWLHLPFAGLACVIAAGVAAGARRWRGPVWRWGGAAVATAVVLALSALTWTRVHAYRTELGLWEAAVQAWPESVSIRLSRGAVGVAWLRRAAKAGAPGVAERLQTVVGDLARVHEIAPNEERTSVLASASVAIGLPRLAQDIAEHGLTVTPDSYLLQVVRAEAMWLAGEREEAEAAFAAVLARPEAPRAAVDRVRVGEMVYAQPVGADAPPAGEVAAVRAVVRQRLARLRWAAGDLAGAEAELTAALADWPAGQMTPCYLAQVRKEAGDLAAARARLRAVLQAEPVVQTAYVQAAEYALDDGDPAAVASILGPAVRRWPFSPELWALLAEAADRRGLTLGAAHYAARQADAGGTAPTQR